MLGEWDEDEDLFADEEWPDPGPFDPDEDDGFDLRGHFGEDDDDGDEEYDD